MSKCKIGILGLGIVGTGVYKTLQSFSDLIQIEKIAVKNISKKRDIDNLPSDILTEDPYEVIKNPNIQIVVELIGGVDPIFDYIKSALENGKHVVTANKELIAKKYEELSEISRKNKKILLYEASVGAAIPLINPIKTILQANTVTKINAVINGTTNFILSQIENEKKNFEEALKIAQQLGYAEADPKNDIEGYDAMFKLIILSTICFKRKIKNIDQIYREGITKITLRNMENAKHFGYKIKLLAIGKYYEDIKKYDIRVHPTLVKLTNQLANCNNAINGVKLEGFPMSEVFLGGSAAGAFPTASSVVGDILCIENELRIKGNENILPMMEMKDYEEIQMIDMEETINKYYLELDLTKSKDKAEYLKLFGNNGIEIENYLKEGDLISIITGEIKEGKFRKFKEELEQNNISVNSFIRVE